MLISDVQQSVLYIYIYVIYMYIYMLYMCVYIFFFILFSIVVYHRILNIVPNVIQYDLVYPSYIP